MRATQECRGPIRLGGVGGVTTESLHGVYTVKLPLFHGGDAQLTGVCLDRITNDFPDYPLQGNVENDIRKSYILSGGHPDSLPKLPKSVGGGTDFLIGIKYLRYHPEIVFQLPSGLTIYKSMFKNADGGRGVIGGPHYVFTAIERQFHLTHDHNSTFLCNQHELYRMGYQVNPDVSLLGLLHTSENVFDKCLEVNENIPKDAILSRDVKMFNAIEAVGSEISYRCVRCRSCKECRDCDHTEAVSIREEIEEDLIRRSVNVDITNRTVTASLPLMHDPVTKLWPNKHKAMKIYMQQIKKLQMSPNDKAEVIKAEGKLQSLGYVDYVKNLSTDLQAMLNNSPIQNFIPWRVVWKASSISTPCRIVLDASHATDSGFSLNDVLAKGRNNMNKLQEIVIRWLSYHVGFHTDVQKMYNCVKLREKDWCFQRYLWQGDLDINKRPEEKVIKTLIYGVKPSGNLAERGIRETASLSKDQYPEVHEIVCKDVYVDDCLSGEQSDQVAALRADELETVLNKGGFALKGVAFLGKDPPESLSDDGTTVVVAGMRWYTKEDYISFNLGKLCFSKKRRGRKDESISEIPLRLTRRHCASKVAEVFDILGRLTPITISMKLDLHELVQRKLDWDDVLPDDLRPLWKSHFELMQEINNIKYKRAVIPSDAASLELETLDFGDASKHAVCSAIYVRFKRTNGEYSCQLVLSRSKLVPEDMSQPRAELIAALVNAHSGEIVKRAFYKYHRHSHKFTDSQIVLHWLSNEERQLKMWVRNRVIEIQRFTSLDDWKYVQSKDMIADMGTRRGRKLKDVAQDSVWINGFTWMHQEKSLFPSKSHQEVKLCNEEMQEVKREMPYQHESETEQVNEVFYSTDVVSENIPEQVLERYQFSNYIVDPNRRKFQTVVRILAYVFKFIEILRVRLTRNQSAGVNSVWMPMDHDISEDHLKKAENYFFRAATLEVKHFHKDRQYVKFSREKDGILFYTGRILPTEMNIVSPICSDMRDLTSTTFCVPLVDKHSPIAYSIINDIHWNNKVVKHSGIESIWRFVLKYVFVIEGRQLVKKIKRLCQRCRYLEKRTVDVEMGPVSRHNMTIAPAFYITQVDLAGPFKSFSYHNKRATLKIWLVVYCCATTSTTSIKVMEDYSSTAFIQTFIRLSCEVGYPKILLTDGGSQLVKGFDDIRMSYKDVKNRLFRDVRVEFEICPVGGHNINGKVERKIREIKISLEKTVQNERLSVLQWETVGSEVSNSINDLPLALGNITADFESMDLLTPNRLRLGRNNERSPVGSLAVTNNSSKILETNERIFRTWFEHWLLSHVPKLVSQPKWFKCDKDLKRGDIVLFRKNESVLSLSYQYGMVKSTECSKDGKIRKVILKYRNSNENVDRETYRSVRELVVIHRVDELDILQELGEIANFADYKMRLENDT